MYLLDTNVISEIRKQDRCDAKVRNWYRQVEASQIFLSVLVTGEIRRGVEQARPRDLTKARQLESWLDALEGAFAERVLDVDTRVADEWGRMSATRSTPVVDCLLAATAKVHKLMLVTRNLKDVAGLGAEILNPFEYS